MMYLPKQMVDTAPVTLRIHIPTEVTSRFKFVARYGTQRQEALDKKITNKETVFPES